MTLMQLSSRSAVTRSPRPDMWRMRVQEGQKASSCPSLTWRRTLLGTVTWQPVADVVDDGGDGDAALGPAQAVVVGQVGPGHLGHHLDRAALSRRAVASRSGLCLPASPPGAAARSPPASPVGPAPRSRWPGVFPGRPSLPAARSSRSALRRFRLSTSCWMLLDSLGFFTAPPKSFFSSAAIFAVNSSMSPFTTRSWTCASCSAWAAVRGRCAPRTMGAVSPSSAVMAWWRATRSSRAVFYLFCNSYN